MLRIIRFPWAKNVLRSLFLALLQFHDKLLKQFRYQRRFTCTISRIVFLRQVLIGFTTSRQPAGAGCFI